MGDKVAARLVYGYSSVQKGSSNIPLHYRYLPMPSAAVRTYHISINLTNCPFPPTIYPMLLEQARSSSPRRKMPRKKISQEPQPYPHSIRTTPDICMRSLFHDCLPAVRIVPPTSTITRTFFFRNLKRTSLEGARSSMAALGTLSLMPWRQCWIRLRCLGQQSLGY